MENPWPLMRTIRLEARVQAYKDEHVARDENSVYEQWDAMEFLLATNPHLGKPRADDFQNEDLLYVVAADDIAGTRDLAVVYSYNSEIVVIHDVVFVDDL